jgi:hypothetical protein
MKNLFKMCKVLMINTIIFSLIQTPFISQSFAQDETKVRGFEVKDMMNIANGALNVYGGFLGQKQQMMQQQISAANNQKLMSQLSPGCRKPDGTACYSTAAKYFPECTLPASMSNMPMNACNNPTPEVNQISAMITYESVAQGWMNYYDQMSNSASNAKYAVGVRCLADKEKAMDSQLTEMVNNLQRLQDKMNQEKQIFRDNNKKLLEDMNTTNDELFGASKNNLKMKTQDFSKYFSASCQSVIGKDTLASGTTNGGLNGVFQGLTSKNKSAADFNLNKNVIEDDVRREASKIQTAINSGGIDDWLSNSNTQANIKSSSYPAMEAAVKKQAAELGTARARINKTLAEIGYTPPTMDKNFAVDMDDFMAGSTEFFKKKYVNDCVTGAGSGVAIPVDDILKSLEQKSTRNAGTARDDYRAALKKVLESDAMMDQKMAAIKELQGKYPDISITYKDATQARVTETPYDLFMKTISKCEERFAQDGQFSNSGSSVSYKKKVERGRVALQELKNLNDSFSSKVTQAITAQVLSCNGEGIKVGNDSCSEDSLKTTSDNFCVAHASVCANNIQGCYAEAQTQVANRKTKLENSAKKFNANVTAMIARSNSLYEQQKLAVGNITKMIQSRFPGTNFEIPSDMFVPMPELKKDAFGVEMAGDGDLKSILDGESSMPAKIDKLKKMFQMQKDKVKSETKEYIASQEAAMSRERGRWAELNGQCKDAVNKSSQALAKMNAEGQKNQNELDGKVAKFCKKYDSISKSPVGGCGKAQDLAELSDQIASRLSNQALTLTEEYASACDGYNNESDQMSVADCADLEGKEKRICLESIDAKNKRSNQGSASAPQAKAVKLASLCGSATKPKSNDEFIAAAVKKLSSKDQETLKGKTSLKDILEVSADLESDEFFPGLNELVTTSSICNDLSKFDGKKKDSIAIEKEFTQAREPIDEAIKAASLLTSSADAAIKAQAVADLDKSKKELAALTLTKNADVDVAEKALSLKDLLSSISPIAPTADDLKFKKVSDIGEQMTGPCDVQSNSNVSKNMGFDLKSFDQSILGSSR